VLYASEPRESLSQAARAALRDGAVDFALFFSPRTAASFVTLATAAALGEASRAIAAVCLSPAVAAALSPLAWRSVIVADAPTQAELLAALDRFLAARRNDGDREGLNPA
jgi:uroporphyrinogen-III synthase